MVMVGAISSQLPAQVGSFAGAKGERAQASSSASAADSNVAGSNTGQDPSNGPPPAGVLVSTGGMSFVVPGVVNLEELSGTGILFGAGVSEGYGQVHTEGIEAYPSGSISLLEPFVGLFQTGYRHKLMLEYSPTIDLVNQDKWDGSVLQRVGIGGSTNLSEHLRWLFSGYTTYGSEYLRELGGVAIGSYPGWLTFSQPTDTRLIASAATGFSWQQSVRREFSFLVSDTYSSLRNGPDYDAGTARIQMNNYLARNSNWYVYAQANRYSNQPGCVRSGGGAGFLWRATSSTQLALEAGPEFGNSPCVNHVTSNFAGSLVQHFSPRTIFFASASRDLIEPYLLQSRWTDLYSAKLWQKTTHSTDLAAGSGYVRSGDVPGESVPVYRGFLLFSEFNWRLTDTLSLTGSYRYYKRDLANPTLIDRHSWVFCSLVWHPLSRNVRRSIH